MMKIANDFSLLFIIAQVVIFGLLIAIVIFIAVSDWRANKRLEQQEREQSQSQSSAAVGDHDIDNQ